MLQGLSVSTRQLCRLVLVVGLGLGLSACNSLGLGSSSSKPATSEAEGGSSGFSFSNILYGGSVPPSRPPEEEDPECPAPIYTADDSVIRVGTDSVRHQISIVNVARECSINQGKLMINVGVQARVLLGPAGSAGSYSTPVQIVMKRGTKVVASRTTRGSVTIPAGSSMGEIVVVEKDFSVPKDGDELMITVNLKGGEPTATPAPWAGLARWPLAAAPPSLNMCWPRRSWRWCGPSACACVWKERSARWPPPRMSP